MIPPDATEIRSANTEIMTTQGLAELRRVIADAARERDSISHELTIAARESASASDRFQRWDEGFLFKHLLRAKFQQRRAVAEEAGAKVAELEEQLRLTTLATQIDIDKEQAEPYFRLRDEFAGLATCLKIWDAVAEKSTNQFAERTIAKRAVTRTPVQLRLDESPLIQWDHKIPRFPNANGGDLLLYPGFVLVWISDSAFSLLEFSEVKLEFDRLRFIEDEQVPSDSQVDGHTWLKANKDGSPDRRFADNRQIPIAVYGRLTFTSSTGLNEEYQCSNATRAERFHHAWLAFQSSLRS